MFQRLAATWFAFSATACMTVSAADFVNGYTYVAPSYYLTPPVLVSGPVVPVTTARGGILSVPVIPPVVTVYEPAFLHTTVVPYDPVWPYAYQGLPGSYYTERVKVRPNEVEYRLKTYGPAGLKRLSKYEVEYDRRGVEVKSWAR